MRDPQKSISPVSPKKGGGASLLGPGTSQVLAVSLQPTGPDYNKNKRHKEWCKNNRDKIKKYVKKSVEIGSRRASNKVYKLIKSGRLKSLKTNYIECFYCREQATVYGHRDYRFPQKVKPACRECNSRLGKAIYLTDSFIKKVIDLKILPDF